MTRPKHWTHDRDHFYKYTTASTAKVVLRNKTLRISSPKLLNDPFDVQFDLYIEYDKKTIVEKILDELWLVYRGQKAASPNNVLGPLVAQLGSASPTFSKAELDAQFRDSVSAGLDAVDQILPAVHADARKIISEAKILCFSEIHDNILMWSHYSGNHTGAVLQFSCIENLDSGWGVAQPVRYQKKMPVLLDEEGVIKLTSGQSEIDVKETLDKALYTKAGDWAYEKEWRLAGARNPKVDFEDIPFHMEELTAVFLGCRISEDDKQELVEITSTNFPDASIFVGEKSERRFSLNFDRLK